MKERVNLIAINSNVPEEIGTIKAYEAVGDPTFVETFLPDKEIFTESCTAK